MKSFVKSNLKLILTSHHKHLSISPFLHRRPSNLQLHFVLETVEIIAQLLYAERVNGFPVGDANDLDGKVHRVDEMFHQLPPGELHLLVVEFFLASHDIHLAVEFLLKVVRDSIVKLEIFSSELLGFGKKRISDGKKDLGKFMAENGSGASLLLHDLVELPTQVFNHFENFVLVVGGDVHPLFIVFLLLLLLQRQEV